MPAIVIKFPEGVFDAEARGRIAARVTAAANTVEQIGDDPRHQFLTWVVIEEVKAGGFLAGGRDPLAVAVPVLVTFNYPEGVIDESGRALAARLIQDAVAAEGRPAATSVIMAAVPDGTWGANGELWRLPDFARAAGFKHLQHLVAEACA